MPRRNLVGPRVREARHRLPQRLTQAALSARMQVAGFGLDRVAIAKIEMGYREVRDYEVVGLAHALGVSAAWLLGEDSPSPSVR
jgi:HTH-type transcriptional regulator, cell division transcriptional repressor